jgi:glycosyltransferase involved in cell wall biosynthesis
VSGKRVAMVTDAVLPFHTGGKERVLFEIAKNLSAAGYEVDVYTMQWWSGSRSIRQEGITFHAMSRYHPLYTPDGRRSLREAVSFGFWTATLALKPFDYLYVDSIPFVPLIVGRGVAWARRKRLITIWYEYWGTEYWRSYLPGVRGAVGAFLELLASKCPDSLVSISSHTTSRLRRGSKKRNIVTIPLGVDLESIDGATPSHEQFDVLCAGRLLNHKNFDLVVDAIAELRLDHPDLRCLIIGGGPEEASLQRRIAELDLRDQVVLRPFVESSSELYGLMKSAKMLILPSIREGFGLVAIEANACGIPVVTTRHPENAARDLIEDGRNGLLCEATADDIADKIGDILEGRSNLMDAASLRRDADGRDWSHMAKAFEAELTATEFPRDETRLVNAS